MQIITLYDNSSSSFPHILMSHVQRPTQLQHGSISASFESFSLTVKVLQDTLTLTAYHMYVKYMNILCFECPCALIFFSTFSFDFNPPLPPPTKKKTPNAMFIYSNFIRWIYLIKWGKWLMVKERKKSLYIEVTRNVDRTCTGELWFHDTYCSFADISFAKIRAENANVTFVIYKLLLEKTNRQSYLYWLLDLKK